MDVITSNGNDRRDKRDRNGKQWMRRHMSRTARRVAITEQEHQKSWKVRARAPRMPNNTKKDSKTRNKRQGQARAPRETEGERRSPRTPRKD